MFLHCPTTEGFINLKCVCMCVLVYLSNCGLGHDYTQQQGTSCQQGTCLRSPVLNYAYIMSQPCIILCLCVRMNEKEYQSPVSPLPTLLLLSAHIHHFTNVAQKSIQPTVPDMTYQSSIYISIYISISISASFYLKHVVK